MAGVNKGRIVFSLPRVVQKNGVGDSVEFDGCRRRREGGVWYLDLIAS